MRVLFFLLDTLFLLLIGATLLRAWMNTRRVRMTEQPGPFVMALSNWLVMPLRRLLPRRWVQLNADIGSLIAAVLLAVAYVLLFGLLVGGVAGLGAWGGVVFGWPLLALQMLLRAALQLVMLLALVHAILSWVQPRAPVQYMLGRLLDPLVAPIRRVLPLVGGVDLSLLVLMLLAQIGLMLIA